MSEDAAPKLYLIAPAHPGLGEFPEQLARILDSFDIACVRMGSADASERALLTTADALRPICHQRDIPLVVTDHFRIVPQAGLDGVHLTDGARRVRAAREALAPDAIVGAFSGASRHDGMTAAEIGADYVSFGPLSPSSLGDGTLAGLDLFGWWSEMIEVPVVAESHIAPEQIQDLTKCCDFIALGEELWSSPEGPLDALAEFVSRM